MLISTNAYRRRTNAYWYSLGGVVKREYEKRERRMDFENFIYIPQTEIAQKLSMHPQSVHRAIKLLVQKGILLRNERGYRLNPHYGWKGKSKKLQNARLELVKG